MKLTTYAMVIFSALLPATFAINCESGLNHNLGTSCHSSIGNFACSSNNRGYIVRPSLRVHVLIHALSLFAHDFPAMFVSKLPLTSSFSCNARAVETGVSTRIVPVVQVATTAAVYQGIRCMTRRCHTVDISDSFHSLLSLSMECMLMEKHI